MLQLFQTEWCRGSKQVRQRLTELGIDFVARQVPAEPEERDVLEFHTGVRTVPVLMFEDGAVVVGTERILDYLDNLPERSDAEAQREKAHRALCKQCAELGDVAGDVGPGARRTLPVTSLGSEECDSTPTSPEQASPPAAAPTS